MIDTTNINEARRKIQELKKENKEVIVKAQDEDFNRKILENKDVHVLLSPEIHNRKDKLKERDSGLNEVLCDIAAKNKIKIGINIGELKDKEKKEKAIIISRIIQNIMLCRKSGAEIKLFGNFNQQDAFAFLQTLGASTQQAKKAIS